MDWNLGTAARTLFQEARGEPIEGQQAVAHVIHNRLNSGKWGASLFEVCTSEYRGIYQFSGWSRTDPNRIKAARLADNDPQLLPLAAIMQSVIGGAPDFTGGASHYFAMSIPAPAWAAEMTPCGQFGHQLFFKTNAPTLA